MLLFFNLFASSCVTAVSFIMSTPSSSRPSNSVHQATSIHSTTSNGVRKGSRSKRSKGVKRATLTSYLPSGAPKLPLSFGVEFEYLFCVNRARINRDPSHKLFIREDDPRHPDDQASRTPSQHPFFARLARILRDKNLTVRVMPEPKTDDTGYKHWTITEEPNSDLKRTFHGLVLGSEGKVIEATLYEWETKGMELVSRVLKAPEPDYKGIHPSISECGRYLNMLKAGSTDWFLIARPDNGGLHVHLGIDPGASIKSKTMTDVPLKILQHLAYILIEYEDIISCFHDWERRGIFGYQDI